MRRPINRLPRSPLEPAPPPSVLEAGAAAVEPREGRARGAPGRASPAACVRGVTARFSATTVDSDRGPRRQQSPQRGAGGRGRSCSGGRHPRRGLFQRMLDAVREDEPGADGLSWTRLAMATALSSRGRPLPPGRPGPKPRRRGGTSAPGTAAGPDAEPLRRRGAQAAATTPPVEPPNAGRAGGTEGRGEHDRRPNRRPAPPGADAASGPAIARTTAGGRAVTRAQVEEGARSR